MLPDFDFSNHITVVGDVIVGVLFSVCWLAEEFVFLILINFNIYELEMKAKYQPAGQKLTAYLA